VRPDLSRLRRRLRLPFWHREDIEAEIASHVQDVENETRAQGTDDAEARRAALERLGDLNSLGDSLQAVHHGWIGGATVQRRFARILFVAALVVLAGIGLIATVGKVSDVARSRREVGPPPSASATSEEWLAGHEFTAVNPSEPLAADELKAAFSELGLTIERFTYEVPFAHQLHFTVQIFVDGKAKDMGEGGTGMSFNPGKQRLMLIVHPDDEAFRYGFAHEGSRVTSAHGFPMRDYTNGTQGTLRNVRLVGGKKVAIYVLAANRPKRGIRGEFSDRSLEEIVSMYDMVAVIFAELQRIKEIGQR